MNVRRGMGLVLCFAIAVLATGCADEKARTALYRAEQAHYAAGKMETEARLGNAKPDSATLLRLREAFAKVRAAAPGPYRVEGVGEARAISLGTLRLVASAEASCVRLALEANRPDLAIDAARRLQEEAAADTATARQAAFMEVAAYRAMRRYDDAIVQMKRILRAYPPKPPTAQGEDPVLTVPDAIVELKRALGDEEGAKRELREALQYYQRVVSNADDPRLEAQVRARILRTNLDLGQAGRALEEANTLERLVASTPSLRPMLAEVAFAKGKIRAQTEKDPTEGIAILDRIAIDLPDSPLAPRAIFEAGAQAEAKNRLDLAKARYEAVLQRFPRSSEVAPLALYRLAMIEEKTGEWRIAKGTLESIPVRYPRSAAAAEAPMAIIQHYMRVGQASAAKLYFPKALATYRELVRKDEGGPFATVVRFKMYQIHLVQQDSTALYAMTDEMLASDPRHPYTAQAILESAKAARQFGNSPRAVAYLRRFLQNFPNSPLVGDVRREIQEHGG